ncbi:MAG: TolC family protein [Alcaligenaceae bacterium]|nr:TolC family protein [Alcaligenaceae bacterium]
MNYAHILLIAALSVPLLSGCSTLETLLGSANTDYGQSDCMATPGPQPSIDHLLAALSSPSLDSGCMSQKTTANTTGYTREVPDKNTSKPTQQPPSYRVANTDQKQLTVQPAPKQSALLETATNDLSAKNISGTKQPTLSDAVSRALMISPEVKAAMNELDGAMTDIDVVRGGYFPKLQVATGPDTGQKGNLGYDILLSQMLYDWGRVDSRVSVAKATSRQKVEQLLIARSEVALDLVEVYYDFQDAQARLEAVEKYQKRLKNLAELVKDRVAAGYVDTTELTRLRQDQAYADEQLATEKGRLLTAMANYRILVESAPQKLKLPTLPPVMQLLTDPKLIDKVILRSPHYRQAQEDLAIADANVDRADAGLLPELRLEGNSLRREIGGKLTTDSTVGLRLLMTIDGPSTFKLPNAERQRRLAAKSNVETVRRDLIRKLNTWQESEVALKSRVSALNSRIGQLNTTLTTYQEQFSLGFRGVNDLLYAEKETFESSRQKINTQSEYQRIAYRAAAQVGLISHLLKGQFEDVLKR